MTAMISFIQPGRLWMMSVIPVLLLAYWLLMRRTSTRTRKFGIDKLERVLPKQASWKRHIAVVAAVISLAALIVAWAQPRDQVDVPRERATIVLAIDVSDRANWPLGKPAGFSCCHAMTWTPPGSKGLPAPPWTVVR